MKGFTLFLSILAIVAAGISGMLYMMVGKEKGDLAERLRLTTTQLTDTKQRVTELTTERDELKTHVADLENSLNDLKARNTTLEARNGQLARDITQAREQLGSRTSDEEAATRQIGELNRQLLEARAAASAAAGNATAEQVAAYQAKISTLEAQLAALHSDGGDGDATASLANVPSDLSGNVIDIGPKSAFVILDIGSRNGAVPSLEMTLRRGSIIVARVRLTEVKETYSVAQVLPRTGTGNVRPGDTATRS